MFFSFDVLEMLKREVFRGLVSLCGVQYSKKLIGSHLTRAEDINSLPIACRHKLNYEVWFVLNDIFKMEHGTNISSHLDRFMQSTVDHLSVDDSGAIYGDIWHRYCPGRYVSSVLYPERRLKAEKEGA